MAKKTISLGLWSDELRAALHSVFGDFTIFPLGAVPKRDSHGEVRLISDHTRSGLNAVTDRTSFRHSLTAFQDVARFLERGYSFAVADVSSAFANLPLHPSLWPHFKLRFFAAPSDDVEPFSCMCMEIMVMRLCQERGIYFSRKLWCRWRKR